MAKPLARQPELTETNLFHVYRVNEEVVIRLKWGQTEYKGRLVSIDSYMNIQLSGAEEWIDQQMTSALGQVLIRYVHKFPVFHGLERERDGGEWHRVICDVMDGWKDLSKTNII